MSYLKIGKNITIRCFEPSRNAPIQRVLVRYTFVEWKLKGYALIHHRDGNINTLLGGVNDSSGVASQITTKKGMGRSSTATTATVGANPSSLTSGVPLSPVLIEDFDMLSQYHHPEFTYHLITRTTTLLPTFAVMLSMIYISNGLFTLKDLKANRKLKSFTLTEDDEAIFEDYEKNGSPFGLRPPLRTPVDGLLTNAHATAFVTSTQGLHMPALRTFYDSVHFPKFALKKLKRYSWVQDSWNPLFQPNALYLFYGVEKIPKDEVRLEAAKYNVQLMIKDQFHYRLLPPLGRTIASSP